MSAVAADAKNRDQLLEEVQMLRRRLAALESTAARVTVDGPFGGLLEATPDALVIVDTQGLIQVVNAHLVPRLA